MTRYISATDTAKLIRDTLADAFPGQKFSVKTSKYSMGASVHIRWQDGPTEAQVDKIASFFSGATFDSSIDLKSYHTSHLNGETVHFGADFVFCDRVLSESAKAIVTQEFQAKFPGGIVKFNLYYGDWRCDDDAMQREYRYMQTRRSFYVHPVTESETELMQQHRDF